MSAAWQTRVEPNADDTDRDNRPASARGADPRGVAIDVRHTL